MPNSEEQSSEKEVLKKDGESIAEIIKAKNKAIAEAAAAGDYDKVTALAQEVKKLEEIGNKPADNVQKETVKEEAGKISTKEDLAKANLQDQQTSAEKIKAILEKLKGKDVKTSTVENSKLEITENIKPVLAENAGRAVVEKTGQAIAKKVDGLAAPLIQPSFDKYNTSKELDMEGEKIWRENSIDRKTEIGIPLDATEKKPADESDENAKPAEVKKTKPIAE